MTDVKTGSGRWRRWLLVGSLALNLAVVGAVLGFALIADGHGPHGPRAGGPEGMPYFRALSEPDREDMRRALRDAFRRDLPARADVTEDYRAALAALRAEPFDAEAFRNVLDRQAVHARERLSAAQAVMVDFVAQMSPEARHAYAERLAERLDRLEARWKRRAQE